MRLPRHQSRPFFCVEKARAGCGQFAGEGSIRMFVCGGGILRTDILCRKVSHMLPRNIGRGLRVSSILIGCGGIFALLAVAPTHASNPTRQTQLTFSTSIRLPGVMLAAGTYEFSLPERTNGNPTLVLVRENRSPFTLLYEGHTIPVARPAGLPDSQ